MKLSKQKKRLQARINSWNNMPNSDSANSNDKAMSNNKRTYCRKPGSNNK